MVEAAVSLGGRDVKPGLNIFRFANRIPLLFEPGSDVVSKQAQEVDWGRYKIDKSSARIGVFVSVVSTRVPFRGTGKEHIAEEVKELAEEARRPRLMVACAGGLPLTSRTLRRCVGQEGFAAVRLAAVQEAGKAPGVRRRASLRACVALTHRRPTAARQAAQGAQEGADALHPRRGACRLRRPGQGAPLPLHVSARQFLTPLPTCSDLRARRSARQAAAAA